MEFIQKFGLKIPPKSYLALGDNHAMSADRRDFGFVPEANVRGGPDSSSGRPAHAGAPPTNPLIRGSMARAASSGSLPDSAFGDGSTSSGAEAASLSSSTSKQLSSLSNKRLRHIPHIFSVSLIKLLAN